VTLIRRLDDLLRRVSLEYGTPIPEDIDVALST